MSQHMEMGSRRFGAFNRLGLYTLCLREMRRFMNVWTQTLLAPLVTAGLFLAIFNLAIGPSRGTVMGVSFLEFLAPGILMMTVIQNAFANTSSSIMISKVQGNIVDTLMPPLSPLELTIGFLAGSVIRGVMVGALICGMMMVFAGAGLAHPLWALTHVFLAATLLGAMGIMAGIWSAKFDQMAAITNFVVTPLSFLSGTFYSVARLPEPLRTLSHFNPIFYLIDGLRFGMIGQSDAAPLLGLCVMLAVTGAAVFGAYRMFASGYRLKS